MKRLLVPILFFILFCSIQLDAQAATPIISAKKSVLTDCYFHYDGQIWVYSTSSYKNEVKKAVQLLNKRFNIFRYTTAKTKRDVWVKDRAKAPSNTLLAMTTQYTGSIVLYKNNMKYLNKSRKILAIAHELGHAAGLDHADSRSSLMYPYIDLMKAKGLSAADTKALRKARTRASTRNKQWKKQMEPFLKAERYNVNLRYRLKSTGSNSLILLFTKRGTSYRSSNTRIMEVMPNGIITMKKRGKVTLTVKNAGKKHIFHLLIV